jgi:hypothetical protein
MQDLGNVVAIQSSGTVPVSSAGSKDKIKELTQLASILDLHRLEVKKLYCAMEFLTFCT